MKTMLPSLGNVILLKEKGGWESHFPGRLIKSPGSPRRREAPGIPEEKQGVWGSQGEEKDIFFSYIALSSVQLLNHIWLFATPWTAACQASLSITDSRSLLKLMSIELVMPSNHLTLCHHLLLLPSIIPSIRVISNQSVLGIRWPKNWSFSFSISPSNECSGLISFRMNWLDHLAVQETLKSLLQHHSSKVSIFWLSDSFGYTDVCWQSNVSAF